MWFDWRRHHDCKRFEVDIYGCCFVCKMNEDLILLGLEAVPLDMPGAYDFKVQPIRIILQSIRGEPPETKPS